VRERGQHGGSTVRPVYSVRGSIHNLHVCVAATDGA